MVEQDPPENPGFGWRYLGFNPANDTFEYISLVNEGGPDAGPKDLFAMHISADGLNGGWWYTLFLLSPDEPFLNPQVTVIGSYGSHEDLLAAAENMGIASEYAHPENWARNFQMLRELTQ